MRAVNLLPVKERGRAFQPTRTQVVVIGAVALASGLGYWGYSAHADASHAEAALAAAQTERDQVEAVLQKRKADGSGAVSLAGGLGFVAGAALARTDGERLLRRVATVTPESVWYGNLRAGRRRRRNHRGRPRRHGRRGHQRRQPDARRLHLLPHPGRPADGSRRDRPRTG